MTSIEVRSDAEAKVYKFIALGGLGSAMTNLVSPSSIEEIVAPRADGAGMNYAELAEAFLARGDVIEALTAERDRALATIERQQVRVAERDATIARVKALCDNGVGCGDAIFVSDIRTAIAGTP